MYYINVKKILKTHLAIIAILDIFAIQNNNLKK